MVPPPGTNMYRFQQKLKALKAKICTWNREEFGNIFKYKKRLISELDLINKEGMENGWNEDMKAKEKDLWGQLEARERQEGIFWKQKARVKWPQEGERNTNFFHNSVIQNRSSSRIQKLRKADGSRIETRQEIEEELTQYFSKILSEDRDNRGEDIERITCLIPRSVTRENNEMLIKPVMMRELEEVVNQMALG